MSDQQEDDYGWFSAADFDRVLQAIARHTHPERYILVGGQSLVGWAILFKIPIPTTGYPALTQDADFFGTKAEAEFLAQAIGATVKIATKDWPNRVRRVEEKRRKERALREHARRQDQLRPKGDAFYSPAKR